MLVAVLATDEGEGNQLFAEPFRYTIKKGKAGILQAFDDEYFEGLATQRC